jgi:hypothetical protein
LRLVDGWHADAVLQPRDQIAKASSSNATATPAAGGANFYPIFTTRDSHAVGCQWQLGGTSTAEFGPLLFLTYPGRGFTPILRTNDFRRVLSDNPCEEADRYSPTPHLPTSASCPSLGWLGSDSEAGVERREVPTGDA